MHRPGQRQPLTYWQDTVILVTWDDWGGWYDHVHPPPLPAAAPAIASSYAYGFRVPLLVVSAYTPAGTVDSNTAGLDFGTILKFIEEVFNLSNINSGDLGSFADQCRTAISAISSSSANRRMISRVFSPFQARLLRRSQASHGSARRRLTTANVPPPLQFRRRFRSCDSIRFFCKRLHTIQVNMD